jgi:hypothetical protein
MNYHLGIALAEKGELEAGLDAIRRAPITLQTEGLEEVRRWEHEVERLIELRPRASGILSGSARPEGGEEALDFARLCWFSGYHDVAVRYFERAFELADWLADERGDGNRYAAARAAVSAGRHDRALAWLGEELEYWEGLLEEDLEAFSAADQWVHFRFAHPNLWSLDPVLRSVREEAKLAEEDRAAWKALWAQVEDLGRRGREASRR